MKNAPKGAFKAKQSTVAQTNTSSATTSGWVEQDGSWYYFDENGNPVKNAWQGNYYLKSDGSYARNAWQGNYYLKPDGKMAKNERVDGGRYYVDASGLWKP